MEIKLLYFATTIFIIGILAPLSFGQDPQGPKSVTVKQGTASVTFSCSGRQQDTVTWYLYRPDELTIYNSQSGSLQGGVGSDKFSVNQTSDGTFYLNMYNLGLEDAGSVSCERTTSQKMFANLIVLDTPSSDQLEGQGQPRPTSVLGFAVGDNVKLTCFVEYGSPNLVKINTYPYPEPENPTLKMFIGNQELPGEYTFMPKPAGQVSRLTLDSNYTIRNNDAGKQLRCDVTMKDPKYNDTSMTTLNIGGPVKELLITVTNGSAVENGTQLTRVPLGSTLVCEAQSGYPVPNVYWVNVWTNLTLSDVRNGTGNATLTPSKIGRHKWKCTATQTSQTTSEMFKEVDFTVVDPADMQDGESKSSADAIGIGVGVGVGIGVPVFLALIILVVVLMKKKKAKSTPKNYEVSSDSTDKGKSAKVAAKTTKATPPQTNNNVPNRPKPEPQPPKNGPAPPAGVVNNKPNPYINQGAGAGDLGVGNISVTGSTHSLEASFADSNRSFDDRGQRSSPPTNPANGRPNMGAKSADV